MSNTPFQHVVRFDGTPAGHAAAVAAHRSAPLDSAPLVSRNPLIGGGAFVADGANVPVSIPWSELQRKQAPGPGNRGPVKLVPDRPAPAAPKHRLGSHTRRANGSPNQDMPFAASDAAHL